MLVLSVGICFFFFFKQKTAYEMRISDWSSDVCSSDLAAEIAPKCATENGQLLIQHRRVFEHMEGQRDVIVASAAILIPDQAHGEVIDLDHATIAVGDLQRPVKALHPRRQLRVQRQWTADRKSTRLNSSH